ncbi:MFS transporter [Gordonia sp. (in: high G+C Gram-positive bacteria)]|uniref:MFS transporter n=1 Tax=Gordonia sp. (in: high G+C Gram-positive bacteria) TaxID=84139 RepID=UPI003F9897C4
MGHDVLTAALAGIPMAITFSIYADRVTRLIGVRFALAGSVMLAGAAAIALVSLSTSSPLWFFLTVTAVAGVGFGIQFSLVSDAVVGSAPPEKSGAASGVSETSFEIGNAPRPGTARFAGHRRVPLTRRWTRLRRLPRGNAQTGR